MLAKYSVKTQMDSSPLLEKSKQIEAEILIAGEDEVMVKQNEEYPPIPDTPTPDAADEGNTEEASAKQGSTPKPVPNDKKPPTHKRKAVSPVDDALEPAAKKNKAAATPQKKAAAKKSTTASKRRLTKAHEEGGGADPPLHLAIERKISAVKEFLRSRYGRPLECQADDKVTAVDELDMLAGLVILRIDYQIAYTVSNVPFDDADEMIVERLVDGRVRVDFGKTCDVERAVQGKLVGRQTGLEGVNLLEVEVDMLVARRRQLVEDGISAAGFRVYDDGLVGGGAVDHETTVENSAEEEDDVLGDVTVDEPAEYDKIEQHLVEENIAGEDAAGWNAVEEEILNHFAKDDEILDGVVNEEGFVHEKEEAVDEQDVDSTSGEESEEE